MTDPGEYISDIPGRYGQETAKDIRMQLTGNARKVEEAVSRLSIAVEKSVLAGSLSEKKQYFFTIRREIKLEFDLGCVYIPWNS